MSKNFILKGIVLPICTAIAVSLAFVLFFRADGDRLVPLNNGVRLSYHDELNPSDEALPNEKPVKNELLGTISCDGELKLRYNADYSLLADSASISEKSAKIGDTGCIYVELTANNVAKFITNAPVTVSTASGEYTYKFDREQLVKSENEALSLSPSGRRNLVIYYRVSKGLGLTTDYYALLYKEVE